VSVIESNADELFIPASTIKAITGFSVLDILGPNYKFKTPIQYSGEILADGNLTGDLIITGGGDPSLGSLKHTKLKRLQDLFDQIVRRVQKAGINCIDGDLIIDASYFGNDAVPPSWFWEDIGNYYGSGVWSLNIHENYYNLFLNRSQHEGKHVSIDHISPYIPGLIFRSNLKTAGARTGDQAYIYGGPYNYFRDIRGTIPIGKTPFKIKGSIPEPPLFFGQVLGASLEKAGIHFRSLKVQYEKQTNEERHLISKMISPDLGAMVQTLLFESNNLYAEALLKKIGDGDRDRGIQVIQENAGARIKGAWNQEDGSGLSILNKISPNQMNGFFYDQTKKHSVAYLTEYLPQAGKDGTVKSMLKHNKSKGHVWLKSGSMKDVLGYAGVIETKQGQQLALTIFINGDIKSTSKWRSKIEDLMDYIYLQTK